MLMHLDNTAEGGIGLCAYENRLIHVNTDTHSKVSSCMYMLSSIHSHRGKHADHELKLAQLIEPTHITLHYMAVLCKNSHSIRCSGQ